MARISLGSSVASAAYAVAQAATLELLTDGTYSLDRRGRSVLRRAQQPSLNGVRRHLWGIISRAFSGRPGSRTPTSRPASIWSTTSRSCRPGRPAGPARPVGVLHRHRRGPGPPLVVGGVPGPPAGDADGRPPLRDEVVEVRHRLEGRQPRRPDGGRRVGGRIRPGLQLRRLHDQPAAGGPPRRQGVDRARVRRRGARRRRTAARPGCSSRTSTCGSRPSGSRGSACSTRTSRASGRRRATTTTATRGASSATRVIKRLSWRVAHPGVHPSRRPRRRRRSSSTCPAGPAICPASTSTCG